MPYDDYDDQYGDDLLENDWEDDDYLDYGYEDDRFDDEPYEDDVWADSDTLSSAGWGTDEDYGYFGDED